MIILIRDSDANMVGCIRTDGKSIKEKGHTNFTLTDVDENEDGEMIYRLDMVEHSPLEKFSTRQILDEIERRIEE